MGNVLDRLAFLESPNAPATLDDGDQSAPNFQATLDVDWIFHNWDVDYGYAYFSPTRRIGRVTRVSNPNIVDPSLYNYAARREHDIRVGYTIKGKTEIYGGINNFTNQKPELQDFIYPVSPLGRFYYMGIRVKR